MPRICTICNNFKILLIIIINKHNNKYNNIVRMRKQIRIKIFKVFIEQ